MGFQRSSFYKQETREKSKAAHDEINALIKSLADRKVNKPYVLCALHDIYSNLIAKSFLRTLDDVSFYTRAIQEAAKGLGEAFSNDVLYDCIAELGEETVQVNGMFTESIYKSEENGFYVFSFKKSKGLPDIWTNTVTLKYQGKLELMKGQEYVITGKKSIHPKYGTQLVLTHFQALESEVMQAHARIKAKLKSRK